MEAATDNEIVERSNTATVGKASIEYKWKSLSAAEQALFQEAINYEWKQWIGKGVVTNVSSREAQQLDRNRILPTRYVLTNKEKSGDTVVAKRDWSWEATEIQISVIYVRTPPRQMESLSV